VNRGMFFRSRRKGSLGRGGRSQASACPFARLVAISAWDQGVWCESIQQVVQTGEWPVASGESSGHYRRSSIASGCDA
jgi:hypothetical protein